MHRHTPTLAVIDSRGVAVRDVAYYRLSDKDDPQARITQNIHDLKSRASHIRDPRLFALYQNDATTPANQTSVTSLSGASLLSVNVDAGWRLSLSGAAGQPLQSWDQKLNCSRVDYDPWLRPAFGFDREAGEEERRSGCFSYADASPESARHNRCGQLMRHDDTAGKQQFTEFSLFGAPLEQARRFLDSTEIPDWPENETERDTLLEPQSAITRIVYNAVGELTRHLDALGNEQSLRPTLAGELYETRLKLAGADEHSTLVSDIHYNAFGQIEQQTAGNGVVTRRTFDPEDGRLNTLVAQVPGQPPLQNLAYAYDPVGNLIGVRDSAQPIRYFRNQRVIALDTYQYDTLYQLIEARGRQRVNAPGGPQLPDFVSLPDSSQLENYRQTYDYDDGGNLHTLQHHADSGSRTEQTAVAALSNRSLPYPATGERPGEGEIGARYDANGNLNLLQEGQNLLWDGRNQLRQVDQVVREDGPNDRERYVYDGGGQRVRKIRTAYSARLTRTHETRYLPGVEIRTTPDEILHVISVQAGRCTVQILHWEKGQPPRLPDNQQRYTLTDHLGSSSLELDANADLISHESYYPYGGTAWWAGRDKIEASYKTIRYSGQERDATGLYYYGFRYYMPWRQRWLSADPAGTSDGLNLYAMVSGNPVNYIDELGLVKQRTRFRAAKATFIRDTLSGVIKAAAKTVSAAVLVASLSNLGVTLVGAAAGVFATSIMARAVSEAIWPGNIQRSERLRNVTAAIVGTTIIANHLLSDEPNELAITATSLVISNAAGSIATQLTSNLGSSNKEEGYPLIPLHLINTRLAMGVAEGLGHVQKMISPYVSEPVVTVAKGLTKGVVGAASSVFREFSGIPTKEAKGGKPTLDSNKIFTAVGVGSSTKLLGRLKLVKLGLSQVKNATDAPTLEAIKSVSSLSLASIAVPLKIKTGQSLGRIRKK